MVRSNQFLLNKSTLMMKEKMILTSHILRCRSNSIIDKFGERGLRSLGVARQEVPAGTIRIALDLGVSVKMITGDQLDIGKETGRRLGMGTNMYPSSALLGDKHKYEIVRRLKAQNHICGMTGDGVNDAPTLKKADIGIAVADAARSASDIVLTEPGLSVINSL